jgi:hypothetical protein
MAYIRVRGNVKPTPDALYDPDISKVVRRATKAGEIPGYSQRFDQLWRLFPANMREGRDKAVAKNYIAEMGIGEFIALVEGFPAWCNYWRSFPEAERRYIPRLQNWASRGDYKKDPEDRRKSLISAFRPDGGSDLSEGHFIRVEKERKLSDSQTILGSIPLEATLSEDGQYRVNDKLTITGRIVPKSPDAPLNLPLGESDLQGLAELADMLRGLG